MAPTLLAAATLALYLIMVSPAVDPNRWSFAADFSRQGIAFALIGLVLLVYLFRNDLTVVPILVLVIAFHEYGHVLAFRLAGHRHPVFRLAPLGGVAFSERPASTQRESVFISMMGPGFSIALILVAMIAIELLKGEPGARGNGDAAAFQNSTVHILHRILWWCAFINFLNLLPFYPLDGGRTVRAIASRAGPVFADRLLYALTGLLILLGLLPPFNIFLILIGVFGLVAIRNEEKHNRSMPKISAPHAAIAAGAYVSMLFFLGFLTLDIGPLALWEVLTLDAASQ